MDPPTFTAPEEGDSLYRVDMDLIARSLDEDEPAKGELVERLRCVPRFLAAKNARMGRLLDDTELEDLAQETILSIWRKRFQYTGRCSVETWVFPFCYHHIMNCLRRRARQPRTISVEPGFDPPAENERDWSFVYAALEKLEPEERDVVRMKHFEQLSFARIGEALGISPSTLKTRYYRGIERLRTLLAAHKGDPVP